MTNEQFEQIECLSKKLWENINNGHEYSMVTYTEFLGIVTEVWEKLQEEPVSEDLEQAIDTYLATYWGDEKEKQDWPYLKKMVIHFAQWQKEQMMAKAVEIVSKEIYEWVRVNLCNYFDDTRETFDKFLDDLKRAMKDE